MHVWDWSTVMVENKYLTATILYTLLLFPLVGLVARNKLHIRRAFRHCVKKIYIFWESL